MPKAIFDTLEHFGGSFAQVSVQLDDDGGRVFVHRMFTPSCNHGMGTNPAADTMCIITELELFGTHKQLEKHISNLLTAYEILTRPKGLVGSMRNMKIFEHTFSMRMVHEIPGVDKPKSVPMPPYSDIDRPVKPFKLGPTDDDNPF